MMRGLAGVSALLLTVLVATPAVAQGAAPASKDPPESEAKEIVPVAKPAGTLAGVTAAPKPVAGVSAAPKPAANASLPLGLTPNAQRIVAIGAINKRTGETRTFVGRPGQMFDFGGLHVVVRTCETTPPWEQRLSGAFLLIDERMQKGAPRRIYSGWMFAESPSLHPLGHPRYDIWVKSCTMRFPDTGPETVVAGRGNAGAAKPDPKPSSEQKSAATPSAEAN
jgi:hypothetical protein